MSATPSERSRASRLRRARDAGTIKAADRKWLERYEKPRARLYDTERDDTERDDTERDETPAPPEARASEPTPGATSRDEKPVEVFSDLEEERRHRSFARRRKRD